LPQLTSELASASQRFQIGAYAPDKADVDPVSARPPAKRKDRPTDLAGFTVGSPRAK